MHKPKVKTMFCFRRTMIMLCFLFIVTTALSESPDERSCILNFPFPSSPNFQLTCGHGNWGGFLNNCCGSAFPGYLYALGKRANQTDGSSVFLNSSQQTSCLSELSRHELDSLSCGIEKLTAGGGGCSDYSVADVEANLGSELRNLEQGCWFREGGSSSCGSCVRIWRGIGGGSGSDVCRFAVLVSMTSRRIDDEIGVEKVYSCLEQQRNEDFSGNDGSASGAGESKRKSRKDFWILTGVVTVVMASLIIAISMFTIRFILSRKRGTNTNLITRKSGFQEMKLGDYPCPKFTIKEIYNATSDLSITNITGEGAAGKVYKGILPNTGQKVAIKHIINDGNAETVVREVTSLCHVRHPNLVALLGCCVGDDECFLVYEFCPNGNLYQWIFGKEKCLSWTRRLEIAIDSARGLWFLHTYSEGRIVHRDIKPTNILLGPHFEAKLSDFGLSKVMEDGDIQVSSEVRGTFGYVDPEYLNNRQVDSSGDVYSFGVVLLQIISGKKVINMNMKEPLPLHKMAKAFTKGESMLEFADPKMTGDYPSEAFKLVFELALSCTGIKQDRPNMEKVLIRLEQALALSTKQQNPIPSTSPDQISVSERFEQSDLDT
ncbi:unnamed protein product [Linum trigynum]|uniref:Protein kinase domain-containing protein n=2 Tax=Linum trigynum TaxID=586398 RepID=A0AAV2CQC8_9ROSI